MILEDFLETLQIAERLPSDAELCRKYGVSRPTISKALSIFVEEGLIRRERGRGTFLIRRPFEPDGDVSPNVDMPTVVLIMAYLTPEGVFGEIARSIEQLSGTRSFQLVLINLVHDVETVASRLKSLMERGRSGAIFLPEVGTEMVDQKNTQVIDVLLRLKMPFVVVDHLPLSVADLEKIVGRSVQFPMEIQYDFVVPDHQMGGYTATRVLIDAGHTRIGYVGDARIGAQVLREQGFRQAISEGGGFHPYVLRKVGLIYSARFPAIIQRFMEKHGLTALFADNDIIARNIVVELGRIGMHPPTDYSIVGHDGIDLSGLVRPELTTVARSIMREAETAVELLLRRMRDRSAAVRQVILPVSVRKGGTVGPAAKSAGGDENTS